MRPVAALQNSSVVQRVAVGRDEKSRRANEDALSPKLRDSMFRI